MAFCSKCGSAVSEGASFCSVCGSPASATGVQATPPVPPIPAGAAGTGLSSNVAAALAYFFIIGIIFLLMEQYKKDKFVRFHSFQAVAFGIAAFVLRIVWSMIVSLGFLSFGFLFTIFAMVGILIWLALFFYWLFLMYKAFNNETYMIPVIGEWASKQAAK